MAVTPSRSPHVVDVTEANFEAEVLERSKKVPVVIDFWAPWCAPCKQLGPVLEKLADEYGGAFVLAKIDTQAEPGLAEACGVQQIPLVLALKDTRQAGHFIGAIPEPEVRKFIRKLCPGGPLAAKVKPAARPPSDPAARERGLLDRVKSEPGDAAARLELGKIYVAKDKRTEAREHLSAIEEGESGRREAEGLLAILDLKDKVGREDLEAVEKRAEANPDLPTRRLLGECLAAAGHYGEALEVLLGILSEDRNFGDGAVKELMVRIFGVLGPDSDIADDYRSRLSRLLY